MRLLASGQMLLSVRDKSGRTLMTQLCSRARPWDQALGLGPALGEAPGLGRTCLEDRAFPAGDDGVCGVWS